VKKYPSRVGNPYSDDFRHDVFMQYQLGLSLVTAELMGLRPVYAYPSMTSCRQCIKKHNDGRMNGGAGTMTTSSDINLDVNVMGHAEGANT
jgi:hypothetical protein